MLLKKMSKSIPKIPKTDAIVRPADATVEKKTKAKKAVKSAEPADSLTPDPVANIVAEPTSDKKSEFSITFGRLKMLIQKAAELKGLDPKVIRIKQSCFEPLKDILEAEVDKFIVKLVIQDKHIVLPGEWHDRLHEDVDKPLLPSTYANKYICTRIKQTHNLDKTVKYSDLNKVGMQIQLLVEQILLQHCSIAISSMQGSGRKGRKTLFPKDIAFLSSNINPILSKLLYS
jgi:hypothetical protein